MSVACRESARWSPAAPAASAARSRSRSPPKARSSRSRPCAAGANDAVVAAIARWRRPSPSRTDVADEAQVLALFETALPRLGGLDILVNNAGILIEKPLLEDDRRPISTACSPSTCAAPFLVGREGAARTCPPRRGRIINIASELAYLGRESCSVYCATKGGVLSHDALLGARVRAAHPGQRRSRPARPTRRCSASNRPRRRRCAKEAEQSARPDRRGRKRSPRPSSSSPGRARPS